MKVMIVRNGLRPHNKLAQNALSIGDAPVVALRPDSSLLTGGRPFFVPTFTAPCQEEEVRVVSETALAVRICRLGKSVPVRFSHRYYDALTVGVVFTAADLLEQLRMAGRPDDLATAFDGSVCLGSWVPNDGAESAVTMAAVDEALAYVSQTMTLKTGDVLLLLSGNPPQEVHIDDHIEGWIDDRRVMAFNCK